MTTSHDDTDGRDDIAVVGLSCRFPGANSAEEFWRVLHDGVEPVTVFSPEELRAAGVPESLINNPDYVPAQGVLNRPDDFDAEFFGISPKEADMMDPQHRLLLECAWEALEDCGYDPERIGGPVGVFAGAYRNDHLGVVSVDNDAAAFARNIANEPDYLATRISYKLNLTGPSLTVQTACSTSLVAIHLACQSLRSGECDTALAGGITVRAGQPLGYLFQRGGILSSDGHCRAFDADAQGTVIGDGVGVVVLKRLADAQAAGDTIRAVVLGSAVGNDGGDRVGFTAPGIAGQAGVIQRALSRAGVSADSIGYVETHGSATPLGDRIEIEALTRAFRTSGWSTGQCLIGSVKTNIGHTHAAAGVAGFIKTVLALQHRTIPASLHFTRPNPRIDFDSSPFRVAAERNSWPATGGPLRAGVSSFGLGGTGAHVVLQQPPTAVRSTQDEKACAWHVFPLSACSEVAVDEVRARLAKHLTDHPEQGLADICWTLQQGRRKFGQRLAVVAVDRLDAVDVLRTADPQRILRGAPGRQRPALTFMFPGLGDQYPQMGRDLYQTQAVFQHAIDECADILRDCIALDIKGVLYPGEGRDPAAPGTLDLRRMLGRARSPAEEGLRDTRHAHPALFIVEYALAQLWQHWGVRPDAMIGYSLGEYVAACVAGVLTLPDALYLVTQRAALIEQLPAGSMLAVPLSEDEVRTRLEEDLSLAAVNGPALCVVAGPVPAVEAFQARLVADGIASRPLATSHAFHSHLMEPVRDKFTELVGGVTLSPPTVPYLSNVTGEWITEKQATNPAYYAEHMCQAIRFVDGLTTLRRRERGHLLLEVGPGQSLGSLALQMQDAGGADWIQTACTLPASFDGRSETQLFSWAAARLWLAGVDIDWAAGHDGVRRRVSLPAYPFQRRRYRVVDKTTPMVEPSPSPPLALALGRKAELADWFSTAVWQPIAPAVGGAYRDAQTQRWLVFVDELGVGSGVATALIDLGHRVTTVRVGDRFVERDDAVFTIDPESFADYQRLFDSLRTRDRLPQRIVHCWLVSRPDEPMPVDATQRLGFHSMLNLAKSASPGEPNEPLRVDVVSSHMHAVDSHPSQPTKATVLGPCQVWPLEAAGVLCRSIDISVSAEPGRRRRELGTLLAELTGQHDEPMVVVRGSMRWRRHHIPVRLGDQNGMVPVLRAGGIYLITGGLGGIGRTIAGHLARKYRARLVLTGRSADPAAVQELAAAGAEVLIRQADVTDVEQMRQVVRETVAEYGALHGVVHAAGVAGGGLIQLKDPASADAVLAPKVQGALALQEACRDCADLDFLLLCSSLIAVTGGLGQVDYCGANAFLDALAEHNDRAGGPTTISVNWDAWREVGMSVRAAGMSSERAVGHPLLDSQVSGGSQPMYTARFSASTSWLVDEHRMEGQPVVPGASHLELVRAAVQDAVGSDPVEFHDITFFTPVVVSEHEPTEVRVVLAPNADDIEFDVVSAYYDAETGATRWQRNSTGLACTGARPEAGQHKIEDIIRRNSLRDLGKPHHDGPMSFGPRSRCLERMYAGAGEYLGFLRLPEQFTAELVELPLHPSLLDIATAFVGLHDAREFRIPLSYGRVQVFDALPQRIVSHHRYHTRDEVGRQTVTADITVMSEDGAELIRIEGFVLKLAGDLSRRLSGARQGASSEIESYQLPDGTSTGTAPQVSFLRQQLDHGITPDEGVDAFERILTAQVVPGVVVCTQSLEAVIARVKAERQHVELAADLSCGSTHDHPRPVLATPFVEPEDGLSRDLAAVWRQLLGVDAVGLHDDFFELGGHSLLGIQLVMRLRRDFGVDVPLGSLFDALTVARLRDLVVGHQQLARPDFSTHRSGRK